MILVSCLEHQAFFCRLYDVIILSWQGFFVEYLFVSSILGKLFRVYQIFYRQLTENRRQSHFVFIIRQAVSKISDIDIGFDPLDSQFIF